MHKLRSRIRISFFFTLLLFCFSSCTSEPVETDLLLPVDFSNVPENMVLTGFHTDKIQIKIRTSPKLIEFINTENFKYTVDLYTDLEYDPAGASNSIEPGEYLIPVEEKRIPMDSSITILSVNPSYLSVQLEKKISKVINITVPYIGKPANGYIALDAATNPTTVELTGAFPLIQSIKELRTKPVDITNANETFKKEVPLDLDDPSIITSTNPVIVVTVPVQQKLISREIKDIPVKIMNAGSLVKMEPEKISIQVKGHFELLNNNDIMAQIYSFIDLKGLEKGIYARHVRINIPVGLIMTNADPQVFTVKIE
jgi:YbbR domain-containing protein